MPLRLASVSALVVLVASIAVTSGGSAPAAPLAVDAVDRTLLCTTVPSGGVREIHVRANPGSRLGAAWGTLAFAAVATGEEAHSTAILTDSLAWVSAGRYDKNTNLAPSDGVAAAKVTRLGTSAVNRPLCTPSRARVPLSGAGLRSAAPGPLGVSLRCVAPRRVLVRVRVVAASGPARYRVPLFEKTRAPLQSGYVAVRTPAGKQLAFASVTDSGRTRLLTAPSCIED